MPLHDDGDAIKGIGYIAIYAANLESDIDECLRLLPTGVALGVALRWQTSRKIRFIRDWSLTLNPMPGELAYLPNHLDHVGDLMEERNQVIHGRLLANLETGELVRESGRQGVPNIQVTSGDMYRLANDLFAAMDGIKHAWVFRIPRALG